MIQWDPTQQAKIELVAKKLNISVDRAKSIMEFYLKSNTRHARKFEPVVVVNVGLHYLDPRKTASKIIAVILKHKAGDMTLEEVKDFLEMWLPLHRIARTHMPQIGKRYRMNMARNGSNWGIYRKIVPGSTWGAVKK